MSNCLKSAIIGYGYMGEIRRRVVEKNKDLKLSMICDSNPKKLPGEHDFKVVRDINEIVESDVQAVFICTPNDLIPEIAIQCLAKGKHVFCEKPPGRTLKDIECIKDAEKSNPGTKLMFGFNHRYHPGVLRTKSIVDSGRMGKIVTMRGLYGKSGGKNFKNSWRNEFSVSGGGILLDQGIHMLDLFNFFCGGFTSAKAFLSNDHWGFDVEDNAMVIFKNDEHLLAMLHSSATFWKHMFQLNLILERGYLKLEGLLSKSGSYGRETLVIGKREFEDETEAIGNPSEEIIYFDNDMSWEMEVSQFVDYILKDKPVTECNSDNAYDAMELVHLCYQNSGFPIYQ